MAKTNRRNLKSYFAELIILVLGISLSFILNELRQQQRDLRLEDDLLHQFRDNLILDSLMLSAQTKSLQERTEFAQYLLNLEENAAYTDSVGLALVYMMNYGGFYASDITYQEMRSRGNSRLIRNKNLLNELIQLYEADYDLVAEWAEADKTYLLNDLLPHVNETFPFARRLNYSVLSNAKKRELMSVLRNDETRYLIQYSEILKIGNKAVFDNALNEVRRAIGLINEELGDESTMLADAKAAADGS